MRFTSALSLLTLVLPAFCAPTGLITVEKANGPTSGKYIVTLKKGVDKEQFISATSNFTVTNKWNVINGFAGFSQDAAALDFLRGHSDVESIDEDVIASISTVVSQTDAPWGLQRISQPNPLTSTDSHSLNYTYTYDDSAGAGVDIYVIDTGIYTKHVSFQGRARWGATFGGYKDVDGNGHGTHCAGTAASHGYGVAKAANLIAVRVLGDNGKGNATDLISGIDWVQSEAAKTDRPSVASISIEALRYKPLDAAVDSLTSSGVHAVVAAGNHHVNAINSSPARARSAFTVGASDIKDTFAFFSNYGPPVKIFAPGVNVISTWIGSPNAIHSSSGTSMATPHVSGIVANYIALHGNLKPADMIVQIQKLGVKGVIKEVAPKTVNILAQNVI